MALPPSPALVPVLHPHPMRSASRELYLLWQRAETSIFRVELELESQLRLQGLTLLRPEWTTYLEHQRQMILDTIQRIESREEDFTSSLDTAHDSHPTHIPPSIRGNTESMRELPTVSEENVHSSVLPENEGKLSFALIWRHA
jgi:hypothetical protein